MSWSNHAQMYADWDLYIIHREIKMGITFVCNTEEGKLRYISKDSKAHFRQLPSWPNARVSPTTARYLQLLQEVFSGYAWYSFHNKTQIKNFRYIYISHNEGIIRTTQTDALIVKNIHIERFLFVFYCETYTKCIPRKVLSSMFHLPPSSTSIKL